jgi:hypothetical protein
MAAEGEIETRNTLRALQAAVEGLGRAQKKTTEEVARFGSVAAQAFKAPKTDAEKLEDLAKRQGKHWRELGHAIGRVGGPLGEIVAKFGGGFGMEGGLSKIAAGAALAGLALKALSSVIDKQAKDAQNAADAWKRMTDAIESSKDAAAASSVGSIGQAPDRRKVRAIGGEEAIEQMDALTQGGVVGEGEAASGLAAIYGRYGRTPAARAAVNTAQALAQTGIPFDHAAQELAKRGGDVSQPGAARATAGRIFNEYYGRLGGGADGFNQALSDVGGDKFLTQSALTRGVQAQTAAVGRGRVVSGEAQTAARRGLAAAKNPAAEAVLKVAQLHEQEMAMLYKLAELQGTMVTNFKNMGVIFGGEGSADYQTYGKDTSFEKGTQDITIGDGG